MTTALVVLLVLFVAVVLLFSAARLVKVTLDERARRRMRSEAMLTDAYLQRLTHQAMARLLDEARQSLVRSIRQR